MIMSLLSLAFPIAGLPAAEAFASAARPLLGLGAVAALVFTFKPLLVGLMRAALLVINPRKSIEERNARRLLKSAAMLNRMARNLENTDPSLASELRSVASRN
jgi:hypothetical protein